MKRRLHGGSIAIGLVAGIGLGIACTTHHPALQAAPPTGTFSIDIEPLVIFDSTGYGFAGPLHRRLSVYSSGLATVSQASGIEGAQTGTAGFAWLDREVVEGLHEAILKAGAMTLEDSPPIGADIPTATVTVFAEGAPGAASNTFSFTGAHDAYAAVEGLINEFVAAHFPAE